MAVDWYGCPGPLMSFMTYVAADTLSYLSAVFRVEQEPLSL